MSFDWCARGRRPGVRPRGWVNCSRSWLTSVRIRENDWIGENARSHGNDRCCVLWVIYCNVPEGNDSNNGCDIYTLVMSPRIRLDACLCPGNRKRLGGTDLVVLSQ